MCGIAAVIGPHLGDSAVSQLISKISHRGPDGSGTISRDWGQLGHRRLSIIDVEGGAQPMANEDRSCFVSFNGEIYNDLELRQELQAAGHQFRTSCDTEVIVHAYEQWGEACVSKLRGMFAFAVLDENRKTVFAARDRMGIKPLIYTCQEDRTLLASEISAIASVSEQTLSISVEAVHAFLRLGYIPAPLTIYEGVWKLPPASTITFDRNGLAGPIQQYWDLEFDPIEDRSHTDWVDALDETVRDSVRAHLRSDVDFGAFLSGGVDSSLVVSYMAELLDRPVKTFSVGFEDKSFSECQYAQAASEHCSTDHHLAVLSQADFENSLSCLTSYGEPFGDHSALPTRKLCQFAAGETKMVLSGDGGDELFAGYERYLRAAPHWMPNNSPIRKARRVASRLLGRPSYTPPSPLQHWHQNARMFTFEELQALIGKPLENDPGDSILSEKLEDCQAWPYLSQLQYFDINAYLPGDILTKVDIASMQHGLEVRVPLLDHHVAEFAATVPPEFLVTRNQQGNLVGKALLKDLAERRFSPEFVHRKKQGFGVPIAQWIGQLSSGTLKERLLGSDSHITEFVDRSAVDALIANHESPMRSRKLWLLMVLQQWLTNHHAPLNDKH